MTHPPTEFDWVERTAATATAAAKAANRLWSIKPELNLGNRFVLCCAVCVTGQAVLALLRSIDLCVSASASASRTKLLQLFSPFSLFDFFSSLIFGRTYYTRTKPTFLPPSLSTAFLPPNWCSLRLQMDNVREGTERKQCSSQAKILLWWPFLKNEH